MPRLVELAKLAKIPKYRREIVLRCGRPLVSLTYSTCCWFERPDHDGPVTSISTTTAECAKFNRSTRISPLYDRCKGEILVVPRNFLGLVQMRRIVLLGIP